MHEPQLQVGKSFRFLPAELNKYIKVLNADSTESSGDQYFMMVSESPAILTNDHSEHSLG